MSNRSFDVPVSPSGIMRSRVLAEPGMRSFRRSAQCHMLIPPNSQIYLGGETCGLKRSFHCFRMSTAKLTFGFFVLFCQKHLELRPSALRMPFGAWTETDWRIQSQRLSGRSFFSRNCRDCRDARPILATRRRCNTIRCTLASKSRGGMF